MISLGIDIGSRFIKAVWTAKGNIIQTKKQRHPTIQETEFLKF